MKLYQKQKEVAENLLAAYHAPNYVNQQHLYISGEMGVGKTYIASYLLSKVQFHKALILCPKTIIKKWQEVIKGFTGKEAVIIDRKTTHLGEINIASYQSWKQVTLLSDNDPTTYINKLQKQFTNAKNREDYMYNQAYFGDSFDYDKLMLNKQPTTFDFVIADEVHNLKSTHKAFALLSSLLLHQKQIKFLGLTGTLFNQNIYNLYQLLFVTNPLLLNKYQLFDGVYAINRYMNSNSLTLSIQFFQDAIWRYIGAQISLDDLKKSKTDDDINLSQAIMPLKPLKLSEEQEYWRQIAKINLKENWHNTTKCTNKIINNYLDFPSSDEPVLSRTTKRYAYLSTEVNYQTFTGQKENMHSVNYIAGLKLTPIELENTQKFKQCQTILQQYPQKTLVFVEDKNLVKPLSKALPNASFLPDKIKPAKRAEYINHKLEKYDTVVTLSKKIATGVDLNNAQNIIWYQVPEDVAQILQAQRRVLRLSDKVKKSKVWFLYYEGTSQADTINEVSQSSVNNSALYNVRSTDNLAKVSSILFEGLDNDNNE